MSHCCKISSFATFDQSQIERISCNNFLLRLNLSSSSFLETIFTDKVSFFWPWSNGSEIYTFFFRQVAEGSPSPSQVYSSQYTQYIKWDLQGNRLHICWQTAKFHYYPFDQYLEHLRHDMMSVYAHCYFIEILLSSKLSIWPMKCIPQFPQNCLKV